jgi:hypothetical protein
MLSLCRCAFPAPVGEKLIGARAYRVLFALVSLPLATVALVYFINHRYSGTPLWDLRGITGMHEFVWVLNFVSFYFLYPSTFNILEVAAVDEPKLHLWETGIMRITRHPQVSSLRLLLLCDASINSVVWQCSATAVLFWWPEAAVKTSKLHWWETGITRITRRITHRRRDTYVPVWPVRPLPYSCIGCWVCIAAS